MKNCIACGMPMLEPEDYPLQDSSKDYCIYCANPDGSMQTYENKLRGTKEFLIKTQGLDAEAAHKTAVHLLAEQAAWGNV